MMERENINNNIADDLELRNRNWAKIEADKAEIDTELALKADKQQEAWITPTLLNGWEHRLANNPLRYRVNQFGLLEFRGAIKNGTNRSALFVLPVGMRPAGAMQLHAINYSQDAVEISVNSNGEVEVRTSSTVWVSLEHTAGYIGG